MVMVVPQHALFNFITLALMQLILLQFANQYAEMELLWLQNNNVMMVTQLMEMDAIQYVKLNQDIHA